MTNSLISSCSVVSEGDERGDAEMEKGKEKEKEKERFSMLSMLTSHDEGYVERIPSTSGSFLLLTLSIGVTLVNRYG